MIYVDRSNVCQILSVQTIRLVEMRNVWILVIVHLTLYVLLETTVEIVHVPQAIPEIRMLVDVD